MKLSNSRIFSLLLFCFTTLFLASTFLSSSGSEKKNEETIFFELGEVFSDETIDFSVRMPIIADPGLTVINHIGSSCGCAIPAIEVDSVTILPGSKIPGGGKPMIVGSFNPKGKPKGNGEVRLTVNWQNSLGLFGETSFIGNYSVKKRFDLFPPVSLFGVLPPDEESFSQLKISSHAPFSIASWESTSPALGPMHSTFPEAIESQEGVYTLQIPLRLRGLVEEGMFFGRILFTTTQGNKISAPASARIVNHWAMTPSSPVSLVHNKETGKFVGVFSVVCVRGHAPIIIADDLPGNWSLRQLPESGVNLNANRFEISAPETYVSRNLVTFVSINIICGETHSDFQLPTRKPH